MDNKINGYLKLSLSEINDKINDYLKLPVSELNERIDKNGEILNKI